MGSFQFKYIIFTGTENSLLETEQSYNPRVSCQKGPTRHAYAWQIGPFWQDTPDYDLIFTNSHYDKTAFSYWKWPMVVFSLQTPLLTNIRVPLWNIFVIFFTLLQIWKRYFHSCYRKIIPFVQTNKREIAKISWKRSGVFFSDMKG